MNVYDFDKTIIHGDSTAHFYLFCLRAYPLVIASLPQVAVSFVRLMLGADKTACKQGFYRAFLPRVPDIDRAVEQYWQKREKYLKSWYLSQRRSDDIVISASPEFLLNPVCRRLGVTLIASPVDKLTGDCTGANCHGEEKVRRLRESIPSAAESITRFYSDSHSDDPLARLAEESYMVKGEKLSPWQF